MLATALLLLRERIPLLFTGTDNDDALRLASRVSATYGWLSIYVVGDGVNSAFSGVVIGAGRQKYVHTAK